MTPQVAVLGSANVDLLLAVERYPAGGETVSAGHRGDVPGGKGLNQAVAAARAGASTCFVGAVGEDEHGRLLLTTMADEGIESAAVRRVTTRTGMALVVVQPSGENTIFVVPGANAEIILGPEGSELLAAASVVVTQLEVPIPVVAAGLRAAREAGVRTILNAAPAMPLERELLELVDILVVNEHEAALLGGDPDPVHSARALAEIVDRVIVTLGADGAVDVATSQEPRRVAGIPAQVLDTTGAGDTFVGVLAASLAHGLGVDEATARAVAAGSVAVERVGAVPSIPTYDETSERLGRR